MSDFSVMTLIRAMGYFSDSLFIGLKVLVPVLFVISVFKIRMKGLRSDAAVSAANTLMLTGGTLFLLTMATNIFMAWYSDNEAERNMMINLATGPTWYQVAIPVISYGVLPMLLWIKKLRSSIYAAFNIVILWFIGSMIADYLIEKAFGPNQFTNTVEWSEYAVKGTLFVIAFVVVYYRKQHVRFDSFS